MSLWRVAGAAFKGSARAGRGIGESLADAHASRTLHRVPKSVQRRGYLAPGDSSAPPGADLLDYRGVMSYREALASSAKGNGGVALGALVDVDRNAPGQAFALPLQRFCQHVAVIAPPGKGKTYGVIAPLAIRLLRAGASVVTLDVTGDLPEQIGAFAREVPSTTPTRIRQLHWSVHPHRGSHSWNPLHDLRPDDVVAIEGIKAAILGDKPPDPRHMDFHDRDSRVLGGLITVALATREHATLADVTALASSRSALSSAVQRTPRHVAAAVRDLLDEDASDLWGLRNKLEPFADPSVRQVTSRSDFDLRDVSDEHSLLVIGAELELRQRSRIASAMLVNRLVADLQGRYGRGGRPVIFLLDEAPVLAERIDLTSILATARGAGAGVVLAAQHVTQFGEENERSALLDSCDTMMLLGGASDPSVRMFQARLGQRSIDRVSVGEDARNRRNVRTESSTERTDMIGARELFDPPFGPHCAFVHSRTLGASPVVVDLTRGRLSA